MQIRPSTPMLLTHKKLHQNVTTNLGNIQSISKTQRTGDTWIDWDAEEFKYVKFYNPYYWACRGVDIVGSTLIDGITEAVKNHNEEQREIGRKEERDKIEHELNDRRMKLQEAHSKIVTTSQQIQIREQQLNKRGLNPLINALTPERRQKLEEELRVLKRHHSIAKETIEELKKHIVELEKALARYI